MLEINGDNLINLLGRPEWDDEVRELTEQLGLGKVSILNSDYSKSFHIEKYNIDIRFGYLPKTEKQYLEEEAGNLYLNHVSFKDNCSINLPYDLKKGDNFLQCINKITKVTTPIYRVKSNVIDRLLLEHNGLQYFLILRYLTSETRELKNIVAHPLDVKEDYSHFEERKAPLDVE